MRSAPAPLRLLPVRPDRRFVPSLPALDPQLLLPTLEPQRPPRWPLERLSQPDTHLFYLARAGVHHAVRHFLDAHGGPPGGPESKGTVLMPAYHHGVEVEAVRAAGAQVAFYRVDEQMQLDLDDLSVRLTQVPELRAVYLTHYVGFAQPVAQVKALCARAGLPLIEDCALALLSCDPDGVPLGSTGDAAVFCLYKTLPVPHGGLLVAPTLPEPEPRPTPPIASTLHHAVGLMLAHLELGSPGLGRSVRAAARAASRTTVDQVVSTVRTGTSHLADGDLTWGASRLVSRLLSRFDLEMVIVRRRRNFRRLADQLRGRVPIFGDPLPAGCCPLFLPIRVDGKRELKRRLQARGIEAIDFWSDHDRACDPDEFPEVMALRREVLELPIHQSLDDAAIDFVARSVKELLPHA